MLTDSFCTAEHIKAVQIKNAVQLKTAAQLKSAVLLTTIGKADSRYVA